MSLCPQRPNEPHSPDQQAADWVLRHDRGLTAAEQDEFSQWLAADPQHRAAWSEHRWGWEELDRLVGLQRSMNAVPDPDLLAPKPPRLRGLRRGRLLVFTAMATAAAVATIFFLQDGIRSPGGVARQAPAFPAPIEQRELPDGSVVVLNRGAVVSEHFTANERRMHLVRGEANFKVAKDAQRPFVVEAQGVAVRAVGTAFNVRIDVASIEVLVTEGVVNVAQPPASPDQTATSEPAPTRVARGERAIVSLSTPSEPQVGVMSSTAVNAQLAWQPRLLDFTNTPLPEILAEFNRSSPVRLTLGDVRLAELRLSATFRSDNVEGFVRLMLSDFGLSMEWRGDSEIILRRAASTPGR